MSENMKCKIEQYLKDNQIEFEGIEHAPAASAEEYNRTLNSRYEQQAKVLLLSYKKEGEKRYAALTIQGHKRADLEKIKEALGASKIRLADKDQLKEVTGCNFGELHPFAKLFNLQLIMDKDLLSEEKIYINAGQLDYSIVVDPKAVQKLENPILV
jgi:Ala-tRNA(Pro) deacylase